MIDHTNPLALKAHLQSMKRKDVPSPFDGDTATVRVLEVTRLTVSIKHPQRGRLDLAFSDLSDAEAGRLCNK